MCKVLVCSLCSLSLYKISCGTFNCKDIKNEPVTSSRHDCRVSFTLYKYQFEFLLSVYKMDRELERARQERERAFQERLAEIRRRNQEELDRAINRIREIAYRAINRDTDRRRG